MYGELCVFGMSTYRSFQERVRRLIMREVPLAQPGVVERAEAWRQRLAGRDFSRLQSDLRADRDQDAVALQQALRDEWSGR